MRPVVANDPNIAHRGCCIRFSTKVKSGSGYKVVPELHENSTHVNVGITGIEVESDGDLLIHHPDNSAIVSMHVKPDETMTAMGVTSGESGGGAYTTVRLFLNGTRVRADDARLHHAYANLWCSWVVWVGPRDEES